MFLGITRRPGSELARPNAYLVRIGRTDNPRSRLSREAAARDAMLAERSANEPAVSRNWSYRPFYRAQASRARDRVPNTSLSPSTWLA